MSSKSSRIIKIWSIFLFFMMAYVTVYHIENEVYFERFPGIFVGFIDMVLNNHISITYFPSTPLIYSNISIDQPLPDRIQGIAHTETYFTSFVIYFLVLVYLLGISPESLVVLPLGVLFIPLTYFVLIRNYISIRDNYDYVLQILTGVYYIIYLSTTKFYGSFYVAPTAFLLVLIILICIKKFIENDELKHIYYIILCLSLLSLSHMWHSMLAIILTYIISLFVIFTFINILYVPSFRYYVKFIKNNKILPLLVITTIISSTFTHLWQSNYFDIFLKEASIHEFILKALLKLKGSLAFEVPYAYNYKDLLWGQVYFKSYLFILFLLSIILISSIFFTLSSNKKLKVPEYSLIYALSILLAQIINAYCYYKSESINFPYVTLYFPLFGAGLITKAQPSNIKIKKFLIICFILIIMLSILCAVSLRFTNEAGETSLTKYENTKSSFEWIFYKADKNKEIIIDFNIIGKYISREAKMTDQLCLKYIDLSPEHYRILVGDTFNYLQEKYVIIDEKTMSEGRPINVIASRALLKPELERINSCMNQNKLYKDGYISIFILN